MTIPCQDEKHKMAKSESLPLIMSPRHVYSRAYHKELHKSGQKDKARKVGRAAVLEWKRQNGEF